MRLARLLVLGPLAMLCGCGNGDGSSSAGAGVANCSTPFTACGGDLVGQWELQDYCVTDPVSDFLEECPEATMTLKSYEASGTVDLRSDGTVVSDIATRVGYVADVPLACLTVSCPELQSLLRESGEEDLDPGDQFSAVCSEVRTLCRCDVSGTVAGGPETDTYQVSGSELTVVEPDGTTEVVQ